MDPLISIIIPVHNRAQVLKRTLRSVVGQSYVNWECIIVDDHSTDDSYHLAQQWQEHDPRFIATKLPRNKRHANAARNYGAKISTGEYINFLDSDDIIDKNKLSVQVSEFTNDSTLDVVTCQHAVVTLQSNTSNKYKITPLIFANNENWLDVIWLPNYHDRQGGLWQTDSPLWKKKAFTSTGGWDEQLFVWQDVELNLRAILGGLKIKRVEQVLVYIFEDSYNRISEPSSTRNINLLKSIFSGWKNLERVKEVTNLRKKIVALRLYMISRQLMNQNKKYVSINSWINGCWVTKQTVSLLFLGLMVLIGLNFSSLNPILLPFRNELFSTLDSLPAGITSNLQDDPSVIIKSW